MSHLDTLQSAGTSLRKRMTARDRQKTIARNDRGLCRCGNRLAEKRKMCPECLAKARNTYRLRKGIPLDKPLKNGIPLPAVKSTRKSNVNLTKGVVKHDGTDGYGRRASYYVASVSINGKVTQRRWSIDKHGEDGAKLCASLQRLLWIVENGRWNPADGDPLAVMSYADSFSGNRDYEECYVSDLASPWIQIYENED